MSRKLILVEDNPALAKALGTRLRSAGYQMILADSVSSGIAGVVRRRPDVSLIDINLPDGNGFSLARQIRNNPESRDTPIIFITASSSQSFEEESRSFGPVAYLHKPFTAEALIDAIEHASWYQRGCRGTFRDRLAE